MRNPNHLFLNSPHKHQTPILGTCLCLIKPRIHIPIMQSCMKSFAACLLIQTLPLSAVDLPIEVTAGYVFTDQAKSTAITTSAAGGDLEFVIHNLHYDGMSDVRVNSGPWIKIANGTSGLVVTGAGGSYGGVGGGFHTISVRLDLPAAGAGSIVKGQNIIRFRFKAPFDKDASAFRVLSLKVLNASNADVVTNSWTNVAPGTGSDDSPDWIAPNTLDNLKAGKNNWRNEALIKNPHMAGSKIEAKCSDCHTHDGSDLKYFGFSNESIYKRARYHGLSDLKAKQLTRYIRSLSDVPSNAEWGRPWNPPYQPMDKIGSRHVKDWAAGGGLTAVLASDKEMKEFLFPRGSDTQNKVDNAVNTERGARSLTSLKTYEIPISQQLPDWNRWLPRIHPKDIWSDFATINLTDGITTPFEAYRNIRAELNRPNKLEEYYLKDDTGKKELVDLLGTLDDAVRRWLSNDFTNGFAWRVWESHRFPASMPRLDREQNKRALAAWMGVKYFEIMREFGLEDVGPKLFPHLGADHAVGEPRGWPTTTQAVHPNAPHITSNNQDYWDTEPALSGDAKVRAEVVGAYHSSAWYQTQMILNAGQRQYVGFLAPVDWTYQIIHIRKLASRSGLLEPLRMVQTFMKMYQVNDNTKGEKGWYVRHTVPYALFSGTDGDTTMMSKLDEYEVGLWKRILNSFIKEFHDVVTHDRFEYSVTTIPPNSTKIPWPRDAGGTRRYELEPADYQTQEWSEGNKFDINLDHADRFWRLLPELEALGCSSTRLSNLRDWCAAAWPGPVNNLNKWGSTPVWGKEWYSIQNVDSANYLSGPGTAQEPSLSTGTTNIDTHWKYTHTDDFSTFGRLQRRQSSTNEHLFLRATNTITEANQNKVTVDNNSDIKDKGFYWRLVHEGAGYFRIHTANVKKSDPMPRLIAINGFATAVSSDQNGNDALWKFNLVPAP
jgi:hypothetical protein